MAMIALHSAATGLSSLSTALDVTANNLANASTDGFKSSRTNFEDLMYMQLRQPGLENAAGDRPPTGVYVGIGTAIAGTQIDFAQGGPKDTGRQLDVMIQGPGFFMVETGTDTGDGVAFTRTGSFAVNADGDLVMANGTGQRLVPGISFDAGVPESAITIHPDGRVEWTDMDGSVHSAGELELATFTNPTGLQPIGENLYVQSESSGDYIQGEPGEEYLGMLQQRYLEQSNVDPVKELVDLILIQRSFEMNSKSLQAADDTLKVMTNLRSF
jgi:flagellar basal-body rod protein FlgG